MYSPQRKILQAKQRDADGEEEGVHQGIHGAQNVDVFHQGTVPQETKDECQENDIQNENGYVIQEFLGVART